MTIDAKRAACVVLARPASQPGQLAIYLVRRADTQVFLGGFHAFPGGHVEPVDRRLPVAYAREESDFCSAALRELFEECGVLAVPGAAALDAPTQNLWRRKVLQDPNMWESLLTTHGLQMDGTHLVPVGSWLTPPFLAGSFDARYFAVTLPPGAAPSIWPGELTAGLWLTPQEALAAHTEGQFFISYPVLETLKVLGTCGTDLTAAGRALQRQRDHTPQGGGELVHGVQALPLRTPTLPPATHTNCYFLGHQELVVVDPGCPDADEQQRLCDYIDYLKGQGARLREVWITHHHGDHVGAADALRTKYGTPVAAHATTAARLQGVLRVDRLLEDNEEVALAGGGVWRALFTPGHAPGHLCFYETERGHLLSGDTILGMGTTLVAPRPDGSMGDYMASLRRLLHLRLGMILPGHGPPVAAAVDKIQQYILHRQTRENAILATLRAATAPLSAADIVRLVYTDISALSYPLAELNVRSHLEKLVDEKIVAPSPDGFRMGSA